MEAEVILGRLERFVRPVLETTLLAHERLITRTTHGTDTFFDLHDFPWVDAVEARFPAIRRELDAVLRRMDLLPNFQDVSPQQQAITADDRWKVFLFCAYGKDTPLCRYCPETVAALRLVPGMVSAMFSILRGTKHIPPHRGPYKGVLRYHLALRVPGEANECRIRVGNDIRSWTEGKSVIFDDSHEHEVWKDNEGVRVVLFVDFIRPLPFPLSTTNEFIVKAIQHSALVRNLVANTGRWEENTRGALEDIVRATGADPAND